ncbi:unnamed protein product [Cuscuta campestris]|uniref:Uncharacterized protein n=1 Tax=Cuscuta campestris TaxID=132261 RepID=A0A484M8V0_9ASTE|nr:unnamed protein product [Cuscuta campestris]
MRRRKAKGSEQAEQRHQSEAVLLLPETREVEEPGEAHPGFEVSFFDYSVENHFRAIDTARKLCGEPDIDDSIDQEELQRFGSSITFLSEWRYLKYKSRKIRFASESENGNGKDVKCEIILPQFSATTVPKGTSQEKVSSPQSCNDLVLYVGGSVWGIDWCPRACKESEFLFQSEIWCLLNHRVKDESSQDKKLRKKSSKGEIVKIKSPDPKKPRGRPRKKPLNVSSDDKHGDENVQQPLAIEYPEESSPLPTTGDMASENINKSQEDSRRKQEVTEQLPLTAKTSSKRRKLNNNSRTSSQTCGSALPFLSWDTNEKSSSIIGCQTSQCCALMSIESSGNDTALMQTIPNGLALPRMVLCLAHNGKVAWDIKWRSCHLSCSESRLRMGYLAVLLGSGALEVWEVPFPRIIKRIYSSNMEGTDPRFLKLEPVFRCSMLKCGDRQSIPLTVEWSMSSSRDMILAGCHDGVVALWVFSTTNSSKDTRPLLCFSADTVAIRSLAWAPFESGTESDNVVITASHKGLKFWDLRDPFHHLREFNPGQGVAIYSLDWLPYPRCILVSCDDGSIRIQSLVKASNDFPVTGKPIPISKQQGFHTYELSSFAIWSLQTSRLTGVAAYCSADGTTAYFQLTKQVETDAMRNRAPHFICGSFAEEEESVLTVITPVPNRMKTTNVSRATHTSSSVVYTGDEPDPQPVAALTNSQAPFSDQGDGSKLPPKSVSIQRVRWNMNKGSEKWLCYGGAAGIVRCQWIDTPTY